MLDRLLGDYLVKEQLLTSGQLNEAYKIQDSHRAKLGVIAVNEKLMSIAQAEQVNMLQATMDMRFGDIAVDKGYLSETQVGRLLELQGNSYLAFLQAIVDLGFLSVEQLHEAEDKYQMEHGFTETDMATLKSGEVDRMVPIFLKTENEQLIRMFSMGVKNLYRLVDNHVYVGEASFTTAVNEEVLGYQKFHQDEKAFVAIAGKYDDVQKMAVAYTKEEFIDTREDALDAVCELINCINGLYATVRSQQEAKIELEPPDFYVNHQEVTSEEIMVLPVHISGAQIKYIISVKGDTNI